MNFEAVRQDETYHDAFNRLNDHLSGYTNHLGEARSNVPETAVIPQFAPLQSYESRTELKNAVTTVQVQLEEAQTALMVTADREGVGVGFHYHEANRHVDAALNIISTFPNWMRNSPHVNTRN
jgi:hypothetical protein